MIPDTWHNLLEDPKEAERVFDRLTGGFHWEADSQSDDLCRLIGNILRRAFKTHGPMPTRVFENELSGHLCGPQRQTLPQPVVHLCPEHAFQQLCEENDTEIYELMSHCPSSIWGPHEREATDFTPEPPSSHTLSPKRVPVAETSVSITSPVERVATHIQRQIRDTDLVENLKKLYDFRCQFCELSIQMRRGSGWYCEAHHIRPLGSPHDGTDSSDNILIVCPNHHKMLDCGSVAIDISGLKLLFHTVADNNIRYHNEEIHNLI